MIIAITAAALALPRSAWAAAGAPIPCTVGTTCTIGEFLYDDNYAPITTADICSLTARDPNEDLYLDGVNMPPSAENDGWYSYEFTAEAPTGYYRATITCTVDGQDMSLDKSFEVKEDTAAPSTIDIAEEVWGYSGRSLDSFGTLVSAIWNSTTRTLSGFGDLVTNIWSNSSATNLATKTDVKNATESAGLSAITSTINENRLLLEQLVNKPIIENFIEEGETADLGTKLKDTKTVTSQLYANNQYIASKASLIASRWYGLSDKQLLDGVMELTNLMGEEGDSSSDNSVYGQVNWLRRNWDWDVVDSVYAQTKTMKISLDSVSRQLGSYGKTKTAYVEVRNLVVKSASLLKVVGTTGDTAADKTLFAKLRETEDLAQVLDSRSQEADKVLANWKQNSTKKNLAGLIEDLVKRILAVNRIPKANSIFASIDKTKSQEKILKNKVLVGKAVIDANKLLLARGAGKFLASTWLEEGSIVFKSLVTNPSNLISQDVPLKYYLPPEVTKESIISTSDGLKVEYDTEKNQYYVEGTFRLSPGESTTLSVTVDDKLWDITDDELASLHTQAGELAKPLEKTSFFAQGVTLKSDIDASLDKAKSLRDAAVTPEQKIRAYREAEIEISAAKEKMDKLKELVTQAGATGTLFGFVGGAQTLAVWGLIIIMAAGFVFLALYMRTLGVRENQKSKGKNQKKGGSEGGGELIKIEKKRRGVGPFIKVALPLIIVAAVSAAASGLVTRQVILASVKKDQAATETVQPEPQVAGEQESAVPQESATGGEEIIRINVPEGSYVNIRKSPTTSAEIVMRLETSQNVTKIGDDTEWVNIAIDNTDSLEGTTEGWVNKKYVEEAADTTVDSSPETTTQTITIKETPTGFLRVRSAPSTSSEELGKVNPGDTFSALDSQSGWFQIELPDGITGWVSGTYASVQ